MLSGHADKPTCERVGLTDERHDQLVQRMRLADAAQQVQEIDEAVGVRHQVFGPHLDAQRDGALAENVLRTETSKQLECAKYMCTRHVRCGKLTDTAETISIDREAEADTHTHIHGIPGANTHVRLIKMKPPQARATYFYAARLCTAHRILCAPVRGTQFNRTAHTHGTHSIIM